ncbi:CDT1-like protein a, chloroplastic [Sesamum alatum]|uniref:CDT1-like protein a, chloroplastic n=1 Tax=Sesamum alatum TaxID=300844 RepID=A0AAE1YDF4_9LAMI|nr:CDT1-like protein a, chloroplastic [Sesamum alatum]
MRGGIKIWTTSGTRHVEVEGRTDGLVADLLGRSLCHYSSWKSMEAPARENTAEEKLKSCSNVSSISPHKEGIVEIHDVEDNFSSPTPVKPKEPSRIKSKQELAQLPEKYGALLEIFNRMTSSLRLLCLRKRTPTFHNISSQVEILTGRKFLYIHLAQIKYILPEEVQIDKILIHDEKTKCMKSDMKITLLFDVVKNHHEESVFVALSNLFTSRLRDFYITHPEGCDVPEAALPEPFSSRSIAINGDSISANSSILSETETLNSSHLPPSFKRHFHQKAAATEMEKTDILSPVKSACEVNGEMDGEIGELRSLCGSSSAASGSESTPMKPLVGSDSVLVETPVQSTPMRSISPTRSVLTCEDKTKMTPSQTSKQSTSAAKKSLDFYGMDGEGTIFSQKQTSVCLTDLVPLIHQIFQSVNFCSITKEELVQKIIMNNFEINDHSEVEMQMEHLEKLVPDWFCKRLAPSGGLLYNVKKVSDVNSICERVDVI